MNGSDLNKVKEVAIGKFKDILKDNLFAIILSGSVPQNTHKDGWSDLDLLVVVETLDFEVKRTIAKALIQLENSSGVKHGLNVIVKEEFLNPKTPDILLDGKTLQAFIDIKKYPDRIVYLKKSAGIQDIYMPNNEMMKNYSISNIGMFLRRNRRTLTRASDDSIDELKELLKKEIRAAFIITKLAVQYFTGIPQYSNNDALKQSKLIFSNFDFSVLEENIQIVRKWQQLNDRAELLKIFCRTDEYIEKFSYYVFTKAKNE